MPQMIKSVVKCKSLHRSGLKRRQGRFLAALIWTVLSGFDCALAANFTRAEIRITLDVKDDQKGFFG